MSFHGHRPPPSSSSQASRSAEMSSTASGMYQAAQALGSIGAPDTLFSSGGGPSTAIDGGGGGGSGSGYPGLPTSGPGSASASSAPPPGTGRLGQVENRRRSTLYGRQPEELHMHSTVVSSPGPPSPLQELPRTQHQGPAHSIGPSYGGAPPPHINLHQATPQPPGPTTASSGYGKPSAGAGLPVVLQPGSFNRPPASSTNTAPATVPTMLQIQTQSHQSPSGRSASIGHSHGYSRSSPSAGFDGQKYVPYPGTPDTAKYASPISAKTPLTTYAPFGAISNSPLGLADIRPGRGGHGLSSDGLTSPNPYSPVIDDDRAVATISNYLAPWPVYALDWCKWPVYPHGRRRAGGRLGAGKVAIGSYLEDGGNMIQILDAEILPSPNSDHSPSLEFTKLAEATYTYPVTRLLWEPPSSQKQSTDLLATSGDHLRLWSLPNHATPTTTTTTTTTSSSSNSITATSSSHRDPAPEKLTPLALLSNSKSPEHTAPLTSLDWNALSPSLIITSSIDTTCTIWDIPTLTAKTQLIAHDKEVFDVRFCANSVDVFVSCGADGSVRMFDLRSLEHSTIIYEPSDKNDKGSSPGHVSLTTAQQTMTYAPPLLRISASPHDAHLLATFSQDSNLIRILDVRQPGQALLELRGHAASLNCIEWSPSRRGMLASGADDSLVLLWDLHGQSNPSDPGPGSINGAPPSQPGGRTDLGKNPSAVWQCDYEVSNISWAPPSLSASQGGDWVGISGGRGIWGVKV